MNIEPVVVPCAKSDAAAPSPGAEPNRRLLMIDDNREIHGDFRKVLCPSSAADELDAEAAELFGESPVEDKRQQFEIDSAFQGAEGVALLRAAQAAGRPYAVAFVDVRMPPGIDGIETVGELWKLDPDLQVVLCTAYADYSWQEMVGRLGHSDRLLILQKPFDVVEVLQLACALTEKWRLARQARCQLETVTGLVDARTIELREANQQLRGEIARRELVEAQFLRAQRLESMGTLASGVEHNLNNMLTPILIGAPALLMDLPPASHGVIVRAIETCAQGATHIVRQLLNFAQGVEGVRAPLSVGDLVGGMARIAEETFPKTIAIEASVADDLPSINSDAAQLYQILMNLCVNAREAMPDGGVLGIEAANFEVDENYASLRIEARVGRYVVIRVSDTGAGIARDMLDRIFDPFFTTKPPEKGSGLGLSTVAGIVRGHGGFINVCSHVGKGSIFEVFLPADLDAPGAPAAETFPPETPHGRGELVLVVDDEAGIREVIAAILTEYGYQTLAAADGAEALSLYLQRSADVKLVLTDILMPNLDGVGLCRALRRINPQVRIVASTGQAEESQFAQLRALGMKRFLTKPYSTERLLVALREALEARDAAAAAGG